MTPDAVLDTLDPEQRAVATALTGPVVVLAGAGTGKTRAITSRIAYGVLAGVLDPQRVLAVTFTARAAGELRGRLRTLGVAGVQARTFHSAALRQLQYFWPRVVGGELPRIAEVKAALVAESMNRLRMKADRTIVRDLAAEIEWSKVTQTHRDDYPAAVAAAGRIPPAGLDAVAVTRLLGVYEEVKRDRGVIDFEDVLVYAVGLLAERADVADAVRAQYSSLVVDEYQDVSPLQQSLLDLWLGGRDTICVVGDPSQTIYSFTGATPRYLLDFRTRWPAATEVRLVRDYRSTPEVVALANALLARSTGVGVHQRLQLIAQQPAGPPPAFAEHADEPAEATAVALAITRLLADEVPASEIAVLYRTNAQSQTYESALADAAVPYVLRGGERFFERREVRDAHLLLRGAARADDPADGLVSSVRAVLAGVGFSAEPPTAGGAARDRWQSLAALVSLAEEFVATRPEAVLRDFVTELDERVSAQHAPTVQGVTLASLHAAKGLEWDAVFLVGLTEGTVPISYAETAEAIEEERRLLYVGITRARRHLALSWALARSPGGRAVRRPSRFLDGLRPGGSAQADTAPARGRGRSRGNSGPALCRTCDKALATAAQRKVGRCAKCPPTYDDSVFEALRAWRLEEAKEASIPAFVIFTDATLVAIAETRPTKPRELLAISGVGPTKIERYGPAVLALLESLPAPAGPQR